MGFCCTLFCRLHTCTVLLQKQGDAKSVFLLLFLTLHVCQVLRFSYFVFLCFIAQERDRNKDLCYFLKAFGSCRYSITEINYNIPTTVRSFEYFYYYIVLLIYHYYF